MNGAETRAEHIDPALKATGWGVVEGSRVLRRAQARVREALPLSEDEVEAVQADFDALRRGVPLPGRDRR